MRARALFGVSWPPPRIRARGMRYSVAPGRKVGPPRGRTARLLEDLDDDPAVLGPVLLGLVVHHGLAGPLRDHVQAGQGDAVGLGQVVADPHRPLLAQPLVVGPGTGGVRFPPHPEIYPLLAPLP